MRKQDLFHFNPQVGKAKGGRPPKRACKQKILNIMKEIKEGTLWCNPRPKEIHTVYVSQYEYIHVKTLTKYLHELADENELQRITFSDTRAEFAQGQRRKSRRLCEFGYNLE